MRTISIILAAGTPNEITAPGRFLYVVEAPGGVSLSFDGKPQMVGMLAGTWVKPGPFQRIGLLSGTAQTVKLMVGDGEAGVFRVAGEVSVISGELSRSKAGRAFWASTTETAGAGLYPAVQLYNQAASGVRLIVDQVLATAGGASATVSVGSYPGQLLSLQRNGRNKLLGGADSAATTRHGAVTTNIEGAALPGSVAHAAYDVDADGVTLDMIEPMIIEPGMSLIVVGNTVASTARAVFQWWEESI